MKSFIQFGILFSIVHIGISLALFLTFGLGLEDRSIGSHFFWMLQQPMLSLLHENWPAKLQLVFLFVNSTAWGHLLSLITVLCRNFLSGEKPPHLTAKPVQFEQCPYQ